jgi:hypothetical protein
MWVALLVFPLGFCSLFEAAQLLTESSSTDFITTVLSINSSVRQVHADADSNAPDPKAKFL